MPRDEPSLKLGLSQFLFRLGESQIRKNVAAARRHRDMGVTFRVHCS